MLVSAVFFTRSTYGGDSDESRKLHPDGLNLIHADFHGDTLHDEIEGENHPEIVLSTDQHANHASQRPGMDAYLVPCDQVGVRLEFTVRKPRTQGLDFGACQRRRLASRTDEREHARGLQHAAVFMPLQ